MEQDKEKRGPITGHSLYIPRCLKGVTLLHFIGSIPVTSATTACQEGESAADNFEDGGFGINSEAPPEHHYPGPNIPAGDPVNTCGPATDRRTQIITDMCMTVRHDYGIQIEDEERVGFVGQLAAGMRSADRKALFSQMAQLYEHHIAPILKDLDQEKSLRDQCNGSLSKAVEQTMTQKRQIEKLTADLKDPSRIHEYMGKRFDYWMELEAQAELSGSTRLTDAIGANAIMRHTVKQITEKLKIKSDSPLGIILDTIQSIQQDAEQYRTCAGMAIVPGDRIISGREHDRLLAIERGHQQDANAARCATAENQHLRAALSESERLTAALERRVATLCDTHGTEYTVTRPVYGMSPLQIALPMLLALTKIAKQIGFVIGDDDQPMKMVDVICKEIQRLQSQAAERKETTSPLPTLGAPFGGGFFAGEMSIENERYALVVAPKADGEKSRLNHKEAAQFCHSLNIGDFTDWYLPSRDELAMLWRNLGPRRENTPELFHEGEAEVFKTNWYWSSTEHASYSFYAWSVGFSNGYQDSFHESSNFGVRAVRRLKI